MPVESISVKLGSRSYTVRVGDGVWSEVIAAATERTQKGQRCVAITSPAIAAARPESIQALQKLMPVLIT